VDVEAWLKTIPLARGSRAKIRNIMSALFSHAMRWEWAQNNPIAKVRQSAKRLRTPDVLTPLEITALLAQLPEPLGITSITFPRAGFGGTNLAFDFQFF
jgi:integrase